MTQIDFYQVKLHPRVVINEGPGLNALILLGYGIIYNDFKLVGGGILKVQARQTTVVAYKTMEKRVIRKPDRSLI